MKVLFSAFELLGYAKVGGLADISYSLPKALRNYCEIYRVVPYFSQIEADSFSQFDVFGQKVEILKTEFGDVDTFFVKSDVLLNSDTVYNNDYMRFAVFSKSVVELAKLLQVDVLHLNDWHTALAAYYLNQEDLPLKTVLTIHNLCYQGIFDSDIAEKIGVSSQQFNPETFEYYSKFNILKGGIAYAGKVVFVSPSYSKEVLTEQFGCGLNGFLNKHKGKLEGILNGIDYDEFSPEKDECIPYKFSSSNLRGKWFNKKYFLKDVGLKDSKLPLFSFIGRLINQKGVELLERLMNDILKLPLNFVILGEGESEFSRFLGSENFCFINHYDEEYAKKIYAASDFLVMPSVFEPCGIVQLIGFRYGVIPIVRAVGGLKDTVKSVKDGLNCGTGFVFENDDELLDRIKEAIKLYKDKKALSKIRKFNMNCDFSSIKSAELYMKLYKNL